MSVDAPTIPFGPEANGILVTVAEFDAAEREPGWRYELIRGVLIVSPAPSRQERDPNGELEFLLRAYQRNHPDGHSLDKTLSEEDIHAGDDRRRADRVIWAGLGRIPKDGEPPTIAIEFDSAGKRNRVRDYVEKRDEYLSLAIQEYWIIDRFQRTMTVYRQRDDSYEELVVGERDIYTTPLLPGFELPLGQLLAVSDDWSE